MLKHIKSAMKLSLFSLLISIYTVPVQAAIQCYDCHGTRNPVDYRPLDDKFRNVTTGGFAGNHRTHMAAPGSSAACAKCHPGSDKYTSLHRDGLIKLSANINSSLVVALYKNTTSAFPQSVNPTLGTCSNVNCHFEATTPQWGSTSFSGTSDCTKCHAAPPGDGSHATHDNYYGPGTTSCGKCHSDHAVESAPFAHATSAGNRPLILTFIGSPQGNSGTYSKAANLSYPAYLTTIAGNRNGNCSNIYCHSPGNKTSNFDPPNQTATWGGALSCNGCHKDSTADPMLSGSHTIHLIKGYGCAVCHADTVSNNTVIKDRSKHVNGSVNVAFSTSYASMVWDSALKTCTGTCHSDGRGGAPQYTPTWGVTNTPGCGFCHGMPPTTAAHSKHIPLPANYSLLHQSYSSAGVWSTASDYAFGCANCHPKDVTKHINGSIDLSLDKTEGGNLKSLNRVSTPNSGYTQTQGSSVICSAAYCHGGYTFSWTYLTYDGNGDPVDTIVNVTNQIQASPDWYASYSGDRCAMCHGNPPPTGNGWHAGNHGGQGPTGARNQCQFCHADATGANGKGTFATDKRLHLNGSIEMSAVFVSACFGCH